MFLERSEQVVVSILLVFDHLVHDGAVDVEFCFLPATAAGAAAT